MPFTWDAAKAQYRDSAGRLVPDASIRRALDHVLTGSAQTMRALSQSLLDGTLPLASWQAAMMQEIKSAHLVAATLATGGWSQMDQSDFGFVGQRIRTQYAFLRDFAAQIASGAQPWNGTIAARAELYAHAARQTHRAAVERSALKRGEQEERSSLGAADHCGQCLSEAARGWQPIGTLIPPGSRTCLSRCRCWTSYRLKAPAIAA